MKKRHERERKGGGEKVNRWAKKNSWKFTRPEPGELQAEARLLEAGLWGDCNLDQSASGWAWFRELFLACLLITIELPLDGAGPSSSQKLKPSYLSGPRRPTGVPPSPFLSTYPTGLSSHLNYLSQPAESRVSCLGSFQASASC